MNSIYDYTLKELQDKVKPSFRAKQLYNWIYKKYATSYEDMKNIPKNLKEELSTNYPIDICKIIKIEESSDGTKKYLFEYKDGKTAEAVLLLMKDKQKDENGNITKSEQYTFCVSSQVGCKVGCSFCLTAKGGFVRDLTAGEIVTQISYLKKDNNIAENKSVNIVYMGMGEPLDNFDNLTQAIRIIAEQDGLAISTRRQTISTSGISSKIEKLGELNLGVQLAISLHAVDDGLRSELIPMNKAYNIQSIIDAVKKFPIDTRKKVMFEYLVIKDKNDDIKSANKLVKLLNGIDAKVNLIFLNPFEGTTYERPSKNAMIKFQEYLLSKKLMCTIRESKGIDISAACGQLKEKEQNGNS
jgi:23S rRNA (adenine2503-C2)-methyltransferase